MLHIWGRLTSINVRKVVWTAQELGLAAQRTDAGGSFGLVNEPAYRQRNPNARVPLIEDGDLILWESNVIVRYLCAKHSTGQLYPEPLALRFEAEKWMDWQQTTTNPAGRDAFFQWIRTPAAQQQPDLIARSVAAMEPLMDILENHLAQRNFMLGDSFSMADIPLGCEVHRWFGLPQPRPARPHLERWLRTLIQRPGARGILDMPLA
ncbi:MAG: glutathione S-transferase [Burkholderiaceae bacterium]|nr:glutathione S-transferase [Burkholderiaceae bacterium]